MFYSFRGEMPGWLSVSDVWMEVGGVTGKFVSGHFEGLRQCVRADASDCDRNITCVGASWLV